MSRLINQLKYLHSAYFSKPVNRRQIYRAVRRHRVRSILQLGIGDADLACRLIQIARASCHDVAEISYTGVDLFEARPPGRAPINLKGAFQKLSCSGASIQLVPGEPFEGLARTANSLMGTDLVIIGAEHSAEVMSRAWFYLPRVLHTGSLVFQERVVEDSEDRATEYVRLELADIQRMAEHSSMRRAA